MTYEAIARAAVLTGLFGFFMFFARKDFIFHGTGRKVSLTEHLLHGGIGIALAGVFVGALRADHERMLVALVLFAVIGGVDEYVYHHDIPAVESDIHAKEHLSLMIFIVATLAIDYVAAHGWPTPGGGGTGG